jgi:hypothetical protein
MNCTPLLVFAFIMLCVLLCVIGAVVTHELLTRWRYDQALRTLIEGETVIWWGKPFRK